MERKKEFNSRMMHLLIPIVIQNLLSAAVNSSDVIMLNYVSQSAISAVSLASNYASMLFSVFYGIGTGATLLCAQYYGKGDLQAIRAVEGIGLRFSVGMTIPVSALAVLAPELMMKLFTDDAELIALGAGYLRIMSISYLCWSITEIYFSVLRSMGRVMICTVLNVMAFALNIALNAVFIFGFFGMPKMGAVGVGLATALARVLELAGCILYSALRAEVKLSPRYLFIRSRALMGDFIRMALPATGNDIIWGVAFSMYSVILGHLGNDAVAANSLVIVVRNLSTTFCFAVASAGGVLLGNVLGEGDIEKAKDFGSRMMRMTIWTSVLGGMIILAVRPAVMLFAESSLTETAMGYLSKMLLINSYYIVGAAVNTSLIGGVFRAGGDTRFGLICDTIDMWGYAVPLGFFAAFVLKLPVMWVYFLLCTDEFVKWPWVIGHYRRGSWLRNITREDIFDGETAF